MIEFYHFIKEDKLPRRKLNKKLLMYFVQDLVSRKPCDTQTLIMLSALCAGKTEKYVQNLKLSIADLKTKAKQILTFPPKKLRSIEKKLFKIMVYGEARKRVLIDIKEWEKKINDKLSKGNPYVSVENDVDLDKAPTGFEFIPDYINTVKSEEAEPVTFCSCGDSCYQNRQSCCPPDSDGQFAYSKYKKLLLDPGYPIFECNSRCNCPTSCPNRVVQLGQQVNCSCTYM